MRILNTIAVGLIAGIISFTIAEERSHSRVPPWIRMMGYMNTTVDDIEEFDRRMCETSGGPTTHDEHKQSRLDFGNCIETIMTESRNEFMSGGGHIADVGADGELYKGVCRKIPRMENCIKNLTNSLKTCLDVSKHETADIVYDLLTSTLKYLCQDRGARVKAFFKDDTQSCIHSKQLEITLCGAPVLTYIKDHVPNGASLGGLGTLHLLVPNVEKCTIIENFKTCVVAALKTCPNQKTADDIVNPVLNLATKAMTCDRLLGKSKATPTNVVNALLVTASFALMSLQLV